MQCFQKDDTWAACRAECIEGRNPWDVDADPWSCKPLGVRTPGPAPAPDYKAKAAMWVHGKCSASGEDCSSTKCCKEPGMQCFTKLPGWASCKAECLAGGPDPVDEDDHPWECKALGGRTPGAPSGWGEAGAWVAEKCAGPYENCLESKCCTEAGMQCYNKTQGWAMCLPHCTAGPLLMDKEHSIWNCSALGGRTPGLPHASPEVQIAPWVETQCSAEGANCNQTMCCSDQTMQCYEKNKGWAACLRGCAPGVRPGDKDPTPWSCRKLGMRTPRAWGHPSLYCFSVIRLSEYEADIMREQISTNGGVGIFACELYDVFASDGEAELGDGPLGTVRTRHFNAAPVGISVDGTAANTALFMNVWEAVKWVGNYNFTDWTVKVDPDAVVVPDRLRTHLMPHTGHATYIINCDKAGMTPMMFGSVEAISRAAMVRYFGSESTCRSNYQYGEDRWLGDCLSKLGVVGETDFEMLDDKVCKGANCADTSKAAYHHFKSKESWLDCYNLATF